MLLAMLTGTLGEEEKCSLLEETAEVDLRLGCVETSE